MGLDNWKENKKGHDVYWGKLLEYTRNNSQNFSDIGEEWYAVNVHETNGNYTKFYNYLLDDKIVTDNFKDYLSNKNLYFQKRLDKYVTPTTDIIIDLGSGWGRHSIQLAFNNKQYKLLAGELSDSGQNVTKHFIDKYNIQVESFAFNWHEPQALYDILKGRNYKEVVLFSSNSIEQIPYLPSNLFEKLCSFPIKKLSGIHIEPVDWQYQNVPFPLNNHYNRNLKEILDKAEKDGILDVVTKNSRYYGHNTGATAKNNILIEWTKK